MLTPQRGANIGLALQNDYAALLLLRCLQSTGSSGTVALGTGVVADIASSGERGKFMGTSIFVWWSRQRLTLLRNCSIRPYGGASSSPSYWWNPDPVPRLEVAFLVLDHLSCRLHDSSTHNIPRDRSKCRRQWLNPASGVEHVFAQLPKDSQD